MKISIDKPVLLEALDTAIKAVTTKSTLQILEGFLLEAEGNELRVTGTDLDSGIQYTAEADVLKPGSVVVNARLFYDIVKKLPDEEVDLKLSGNELEIEAGNANAKIRTLESKGFPSLPNAKGGQFVEIDQQELRELVSKVAFAAAPETDTKEVLKAVLINISDGKMDIVGCDGFKMALRSSKAQESTFKVLIPAKILSDISKSFKTGKVRIYVNKNIAMFENEKFYATARTIEGEYINYRGFMSANSIAEVTVNTKDFQTVLEMASLFAPSSDMKKCPPVIITTDENLIVNYSSELGQTKDHIKAKITGKRIKIGLNPRHVIEALRNIEDKQITLKFCGENRPVYIVPVDEDKFFYLCTPVLFKEN